MKEWLIHLICQLYPSSCLPSQCPLQFKVGLHPTLVPPLHCPISSAKHGNVGCGSPAVAILRILRTLGWERLGRSSSSTTLASSSIDVKLSRHQLRWQPRSSSHFGTPILEHSKWHLLPRGHCIPHGKIYPMLHFASF